MILSILSTLLLSLAALSLSALAAPQNTYTASLALFPVLATPHMCGKWPCPKELFEGMHPPNHQCETALCKVVNYHPTFANNQCYCFRLPKDDPKPPSSTWGVYGPITYSNQPPHAKRWEEGGMAQGGEEEELGHWDMDVGIKDSSSQIDSSHLDGAGTLSSDYQTLHDRARQGGCGGHPCRKDEVVVVQPGGQCECMRHLGIEFQPIPRGLAEADETAASEDQDQKQKMGDWEWEEPNMRQANGEDGLGHWNVDAGIKDSQIDSRHLDGGSPLPTDHPDCIPSHCQKGWFQVAMPLVSKYCMCAKHKGSHSRSVPRGLAEADEEAESEDQAEEKIGDGEEWAVSESKTVEEIVWAGDGGAAE